MNASPPSINSFMNHWIFLSLTPNKRSYFPCWYALLVHFVYLCSHLTSQVHIFTHYEIIHLNALKTYTKNVKLTQEKSWPSIQYPSLWPTENICCCVDGSRDSCCQTYKPTILLTKFFRTWEVVIAIFALCLVGVHTFGTDCSWPYMLLSSMYLS